MVAFYGDDFTGSSASMEVLAFAGLPTVLFLDLPSPARLEAFRAYRGIGIAGVARARSPAWMDEHLPPVFHLLAATGAPVLHYKVAPLSTLPLHRLHRSRRRSRHRVAAPVLDTNGRRRSRYGSLPGVWPSVRHGGRHRLPARRAPNHVAPSDDTDGRGRPQSPPGRADWAPHRAGGLRSDEGWRGDAAARAGACGWRRHHLHRCVGPRDPGRSRAIDLGVWRRQDIRPGVAGVRGGAGSVVAAKWIAAHAEGACTSRRGGPYRFVFPARFPPPPPGRSPMRSPMVSRASGWT